MNIKQKRTNELICIYIEYIPCFFNHIAMKDKIDNVQKEDIIELIRPHCFLVSLFKTTLGTSRTASPGLASYRKIGEYLEIRRGLVLNTI